MSSQLTNMAGGIVITFILRTKQKNFVQVRRQLVNARLFPTFINIHIPGHYPAILMAASCEQSYKLPGNKITLLLHKKKNLFVTCRSLLFYYM